MGTRHKKTVTTTSAILKTGIKPAKSNMIFEYQGFVADQFVETTTKFKTQYNLKLQPGTKLKISRFYLKSEEQRERFPDDLNTKNKPRLYLAIAFTPRDQIVYIPLQHIKPI